MVDFTSISTGEDFELFCEDLLRAMGFRIITKPSRGPDRGADLIVGYELRDKLGIVTEKRVLVECKHFAKSGRSVRESDLGGILDKTIAHRCDQYLLMASSLPSANVRTYLEEITNNPTIPISGICWAKNDLARYLDSNTDLLDRYRIKSQNNISKYKRPDGRREPPPSNMIPKQKSELDKLKPLDGSATQQILIHLHPDFRDEITTIIDIWNSEQTFYEFFPLRPNRGLESKLLNTSPISEKTTHELGETLTTNAGFDNSLGVIVFCEGRLYSDEYYQLFASTTQQPDGKDIEVTAISLNMMRQLAQYCEEETPVLKMIIGAIIHSLGESAGLDVHDISRKCFMDFCGVMTEILEVIAEGPHFCEKCILSIGEKGADSLLKIAQIAMQVDSLYSHPENILKRLELREYRSYEADDNEYEIALSFAGEDREVAESLAMSLKARGVEVFYDGFEKERLWGEDLYTYLDDLYRSRAKYCVMFLSRHYKEKLWTNHERKAAQSKSFKENQPYILPIRLDDTEIPGVTDTVGYLSWEDEGKDSIVDLIIKKLLMK